MFRFESPWLLLLLVPLAALVAWRFREGLRLPLPTAGRAASITPTLRARLRRLPAVLRALAMAAAVVALARPQHGTEQVRDVSHGIAIEMVVDRSSSMGERIRFGGSSVTRLDAVKRVFREFIDPSEGEFGGRPDDLIGMTAFAQYADTICPLTLSHDTLIELLDTVRLVDDRREDGTAIGDALALAAARLQTAEKALAGDAPGEREYEIKSKIVILLTDGENNAGDRSVADAGKLCEQWGVKVYAVGVGTERGLQTPFGRLSAPMRPGFDDRALRELASVTGGKYWLATSADSLREVHEEIDALEKTEIEMVRYLDFREAFAPWALAALVLLSVEALLRQTVLRSAP